MKIGIMTIPFNNNYGGFLQAFALKQVLKDMGHDVIFIMRRRNYQRIYMNRWKNLICYMLGRNSECQFIMDYKQRRLSRYTNRFVKKYLRPWTKECYRSSQLVFLKEMDIDLYIAGSDQCWRSKYAPDYIDDYYFKFLNGTGKKRISYAASFGTDEFEYSPEMQESCTRLLKEFTAISVREGSAIQLLEKYFDVPVGKTKEVLDPTMLLPVSVYKNLFCVSKSDSAPYIFTYVLDRCEDKALLIEKIKQIKRIGVISQKAQSNDIANCKPIEPVELWLSRIYYSDFVVTDSFHGTVFSILFNKPFLVCCNSQRGATRFSNLLSKFNLSNRCLHSLSEFDQNVLNTPIDWDIVNTKLRKFRKESIEFLIDALVK